MTCFALQKAHRQNTACALVVSLLHSIGKRVVRQINLKSMAQIAWHVRACA